MTYRSADGREGRWYGKPPPLRQRVIHFMQGSATEPHDGVKMLCGKTYANPNTEVLYVIYLLDSRKYEMDFYELCVQTAGAVACPECSNYPEVQFFFLAAQV